MNIKCDVYRCGAKANTYLFLSVDKPAEDLPDGLQSLLGQLTRFLSLELSASSKLARANTKEVLAALRAPGYYLQLPPAEQLTTQAPGSGFIQ